MFDLPKDFWLYLAVSLCATFLYQISRTLEAIRFLLAEESDKRRGRERDRETMRLLRQIGPPASRGKL